MDIREAYGGFNPNLEAKHIASEQDLEFARLIKGTPNEDLIAYRDPKVQELVDYILTTIICENDRMNQDSFPIQISRRYKSDNSLKEKLTEWAGRKEKNGERVPDYLGFKIIPEAQHSTFYSNGDQVLQRMIDKREQHRAFIAEKYKQLSENTTMTFHEYAKHCEDVLNELHSLFPASASSRRKHYKNMINTVNEDYSAYAAILEDSDEPMSLEEILELTTVNIKKLLKELTLNYPNEVMLYKLKSDLMNVFENSDLLHGLGVSVSRDSSRTKPKSTPNGYRSEFIGLDLNLRLENGRMISLPIECQVQTQEQYRDGNIGFSAHSKLPTKRYQLKSLPKTGTGVYTSPTDELQACREYLSHVMHISPSFAIAKTQRK